MRFTFLANYCSKIFRANPCGVTLDLRVETRVGPRTVSVTVI